MDIWEEASSETRLQDWDKELKPETVATVMKHEDIQRNLQGDFWTGVCEVSSRDVQQVAERQELDIVEVSAPSETEKKPTRSFCIRSPGNVGAPPTLGNFVPAGWKKKKNLG